MCCRFTGPGAVEKRRDLVRKGCALLVTTVLYTVVPKRNVLNVHWFRGQGKLEHRANWSTGVLLLFES